MAAVLRSLLSTLLASALVGCGASAEFSRSGTERYPPYAGEVRVLSKLPPEGSYRLLGVAVVSGVGRTSDARMFETLKATAAQRGADAVVPQGEIRERTDSEGYVERRLAAYCLLTRGQAK